MKEIDAGDRPQNGLSRPLPSKDERAQQAPALAGIDPAAIDRIRAWNVSSEVKEQILRNYRATGYLPQMAEAGAASATSAGRTPASGPDGGTTLRLPNGSFVQASNGPAATPSAVTGPSVGAAPSAAITAAGPTARAERSAPANAAPTTPTAPRSN
jgi:hypothetical protein